MSANKAIGLLLALFIAASPALGWDCCCSTGVEPVGPAKAAQEESGHGCCPKPGPAAETHTVSSATGCECSALVGDPIEAPLLLASVSTVDSKDSKARSVGVLADSPTTSHRLTACGASPVEPPPLVSASPVSSVSPRGPPAIA